MAVYTDVNDDQLAEFLAGYDLGEMMSFKGIAEGVENSNFLLHTREGHFILTLFEKRVDPKNLPFFIGLMEHLASRGLNCPQPVKNKNGSALGELAGRPATIVTFLEGISVRRPGNAHCAALGGALAQLRKAGEGFSIRRENALGPEGWQKLAAQCVSRADEVAPGLAALISEEVEYLSARWPKNLPAGVIHADLFPDNVFFLGDKLSGLIDFYFACNDFYAYDVATCLNAWCFERDHSFNLTKGAALLAGYQSVRPLSAAERDALPMLCRGSALRFMLTRLYDWLHGPEGAMVMKRDPLEYVRKMRFHRRIGSAAEYGLAPA